MRLFSIMNQFPDQKGECILTGSKWLSEAIDMREMRPGAINLIEAPVGSGKTTWALEQLS